MTVSATKSPTAAQIDELARELIELEEQAAEIKDAVQTKKDELAPLVLNFGRSPDGAPKSLRLEGNEYQLTVTMGQTTSVIKKNVEKLRIQLVQDSDELDGDVMFANLFLVDVGYIVAPEAETFLGQLTAKARKLFAACTRTSQQKPKVKAEKR